MPVTKIESENVIALLSQAGRISCITHKNPDGDAIGALIGFGLLIEKHLSGGRKVSFHCVDPAPEAMRFLPEVLRIKQEIQCLEGDVFVFLDSAEPKLTGLDKDFPRLFDGTFKSINIDHHPTNSRYGTINIIDSDAASSCEIVVSLADQLGWELDADISTSLLTGVYTDTGGLLHSNTGASVYRTVARLLRSGARRQEIVQAVFRTARLSTLKLWGRVLERISLTAEGAAVTAVMEEDFKASGASYSELTGAIDYVNAVPGIRFSMILSDRDGTVKGSLRTLREDIDVSEMAGKLSGGGHRKAAGFSVPGRLQPEVRWKVVDKKAD